MRRSRKIFLILISALILALSGCRQIQWMPAGMAEMPKLQMPLSEEAGKLSYKTSLNTGRGELSGMTIIKKMDNGEFRIAFFNEVGMSYFEGSLGNSGYPSSLNYNSINPLVPARSREYIEMALNLLLVPASTLQKGELVRDQAMNLWLKSAVNDQEKYFGKIDTQGRIEKAFFSRGRKGKSELEARIFYESDQASFPSLIRLEDPKGQVFLEMETIDGSQ